MSTSDNERINSIKTPDNSLIESFAMSPIAKNSLIIKNGVMYILGGVSSGKSTLLGKLMKIYDSTIQPIIICFYSGFAPDETTTYHISSYQLSHKPYFVQLPTQEAMILFFNRYRYKRLKYSEMLLFTKSVFNTEKGLINVLRLAMALFNGITSKDKEDYTKRVYMLMASINDRINLSKTPYESEFLFKTYAKKHKISYSDNPLLFIANVAVSLSKGFAPFTIGVITDNHVKPYDFDGMIRITKNKSKHTVELVPSLCIFDDVAQFPLLTTEHPPQWTKDLFAETRRWMNTFIIAAQRHSLLNKSLRALTHTFFIGYSLIDDDLPRIGKEMPSNILDSDDFLTLYKQSIKPFTFFVYNNKLGFNIIKLNK